MSGMPWDLLRGDTVRAVIRDIGLAQYNPRARRTELVQLLRDVEMDGLEAVIQRLQERASARSQTREESPEIEYAGPVSPVVEVSARPGPSRVFARPRESVNSPRARRGIGAGDGPPTKKAHIPPPSYAILYQLEQEISPPSEEPVPLLRPDQRFEGVVIPPVPRRPQPAVQEPPDEPESISRAGRLGEGAKPNAVSSATSRLLEAVVVTTPVDAVKMRWKQDSSNGRQVES
ncbi:hypothetical protein BD414DRAFT_503175 [Trametes punicea]|nr:hypothetical protein BD414DRAFT_503175 [Trametes punicea]